MPEGLLVACAYFEHSDTHIRRRAERNLDLLGHAARQMSLDLIQETNPRAEQLGDFLEGRIPTLAAEFVIIYQIGYLKLSAATRSKDAIIIPGVIQSGDLILSAAGKSETQHEQPGLPLTALRKAVNRSPSRVIFLALELMIEPESVDSLNFPMITLFGSVGAIRHNAFVVVAPNPADVSGESGAAGLASCLAQALKDDTFSPDRSPDSGPDAVEALWRVRTGGARLWRWSGQKPRREYGGGMVGGPIEEPVRGEEFSAMEQVPVPPIRPGVTGTVWYGTNRQLISSSNADTGYSAELDDSIHYGRCKVYVPQSHEIGSLGSSWWKRFRTGTDDRLKVVSVETLEQSAYWLGVRDALSTLAPGRRDLLVFLHGYNVSFEGAALRAAQISCDLNFLGPTAFFSWPSRGAMSILAYLADGTAIDASENHIAEFLIACAESSGAKRIHVIAHSMGNRGLLRAMNRVVLTAATATGARFGHVILAAPDVDQNLFRQHAAVYHRVAQRTTLYVSDKDLALKSSGIVYGQPRAGFVPPVTTMPDMDTVYVANVDLTVLGHGYVSSAGGVLGDMHDLLTLDAPPWQRRFTKLVTERHQTYWRIAKVAQ